MTDEIQKNVELQKNGKVVLLLDRLLDTMDLIVAKITSGRFIATMLLVWTYCRAVDTANILVREKLLSVETYLVLMGGVGALVTMIVKDYFNKNGDEKNDKNI